MFRDPAAGGLLQLAQPDESTRHRADQLWRCHPLEQFEKALDFVAPAVRAQAPLTALESERFKQIQVTGYDVKTRTLQPDGGILQTVEIRLISKHTQLERTVIDHQAWTWDPEAKVYWLSSGLPDFNAP